MLGILIKGKSVLHVNFGKFRFPFQLLLLAIFASLLLECGSGVGNSPVSLSAASHIAGGAMILSAGCVGYGNGTGGTLPSSCGTPSPCPSGWTQADSQIVITGQAFAGSAHTVGNQTQSCYRTDQNCSVLVLKAGCAQSTGSSLPSSCGTPASCPLGWNQADLQVTVDAVLWTGGGFLMTGNQVRTCYSCQ